MESARCPIHPDATLEPVVRQAPDHFWGCEGAFDYGACPRCGTWVLDPRPEPDEIGAFYAHYYSDDELSQARRRFERRSLAQALGSDRERARGVCRSLAKLGFTPSERTRLLDVGSGLGHFVRAMQAEAGVAGRGVDFNPRCRAFAAEVHGLEVDTGELTAQAYPASTFDLVSSWHCLEHTYDPRAELAEMARITRPGGWLVVEVPTVSVWARIFRRRWFFLQAPTHLYHLQEEALRALLESAGWQPMRVERPWVPTELAGSLTQALGLRGFAPRLVFGVRTLRDRLWQLLFLGLVPLDIVVTGVQALLGGAGVMRVFARREGAG